MAFRSFRPVTWPPTRESMRTINIALRELSRVMDMKVGPDMQLFDQGSSYQIGLDVRLPFPAKITTAGLDANNNPIYGWYELDLGTANTYTQKIPGLVGTVSAPTTATAGSGSAVLTGIASTSAYLVGQSVFGVGIPAGASIVSVDSSSQITLSASVLSGGSVTISTAFRPAYDANNTPGIPIGTIVYLQEGFNNIAPPELEYTIVGLVGTGTQLLPCKVAILTADGLSGTETVNGVALAVGDRALATAETNAANNGPWVVQAGSWTRPSDYPTGKVLGPGLICPIEAGTSGGLAIWMLNGTAAVTVDTTATTWTNTDAPFGGLTVADASGTPSVGSVLTIETDKTTGLSVAAGVAGEAELTLLAASLTQMGAVTITTQAFAGEKDFQDKVVFNYNPTGAQNVVVDYVTGATGGSGLTTNKPLFRFQTVSTDNNLSYGALRIASAAGINFCTGGYADAAKSNSDIQLFNNGLRLSIAGSKTTPNYTEAFTASFGTYSAAAFGFGATLNNLAGIQITGQPNISGGLGSGGAAYFIGSSAVIAFDASVGASGKYYYGPLGNYDANTGTTVLTGNLDGGTF